MTNLVLGIGNEWASDDGVGPEVVRLVEAWWRKNARKTTREVEFSIMAQPDLSLLDRITSVDRLIIVDAVVSGSAAGTLHRQMWNEGVLADKGLARASSHGFGVQELLQMAKTLGKLPSQVELWGIEIVSTEMGRGLTEAVAGAVPAIVTALQKQLTRA